MSIIAVPTPTLVSNKNIRLDRNVLYSSKETLNGDNFHYSLSLICFLSFLYQNKKSELFSAQTFDGLEFESGVQFLLSDFINYTGWSKRKVCEKKKDWSKSLSLSLSDSILLTSVFDYELLFLMNNKIKVNSWSSKGEDGFVWTSLKDHTTIIENVRIRPHPKRKDQKVYFVTFSKLYTNSLLTQWSSINFKNVNGLIGRKNPPVHFYVFLLKLKDRFKNKEFRIHYLEAKVISGVNSKQISIVKKLISSQLNLIINTVNDLKFNFSWGVNNELLIYFLESPKLQSSSKASLIIMQNNLRGIMSSFVSNRGVLIKDQPLSVDEIANLSEQLISVYPVRQVKKDPVHYNTFLKSIVFLTSLKEDDLSYLVLKTSLDQKIQTYFKKSL